jgi:hypothetical protein
VTHAEEEGRKRVSFLSGDSCLNVTSATLTVFGDKFLEDRYRTIFYLQKS